MMEVENLYKNAGVKPTVRDDAIGKGYYIEHQRVEEYPPFTSGKQLELIKWSARREPKVEIGYSSVHGYWVENLTDTRYYFGDQFDNALVSLINNLWQDLTEQERQQIKEILQ